jgi:hypothetical protein
VDPITDIAPNATGVITGTNLYSGTSAILVKDTMSNEYREMPCSGFVSDYTECKFTYPTAFTTGQYKIKVKNQRGQALESTVLGVYHSPELSGFAPPQVTVADTTVTASGFFEQVTGVRIGEVDVAGFATQSDGSSISGILFTVNEDVTSDKIGIFTRGGNVFSETDLVVVPGKPIVSGYWVGAEGSEKPNPINYNQVVAAGGNIHVSGRRLHLVEKLEVSGGNNKFTTNIFTNREYGGLDFSVPETINPNSGLFNLVDYFGRTGTFDSSCDGSGLNVFSLSGYEGWEVPGGSIVASGNNLSGLNVLLTGATGDYVHALNTSSSGINSDPVGGVQTVSFSVPTGIRNASSMIFSGQSNNAVYETESFVNSLAVITGLEGTGVGGTLTTGDVLGVTGVNFYTLNVIESGTPVAIISGTGYQHGVTGEIKTYVPSQLYETGLSGVGNTFISSIQLETQNNFIGTGNLVLLNGGDQVGRSFGFGGLADRMIGFEGSTNPLSVNYFNTQRDYFSEPLVFNGTWVDATGLGPEMGVTGSVVEISGQGFNAVDMDQVFLMTQAVEDAGDVGVDFDFATASILTRVTSGTRDSDTKISIQIPRMAINQATDAQILISGGTSDMIGPFSVLPDAPVFVENVLPEGAFNIQSLPDGVASYSIYECIELADGVYVKFIVSYTQFPGGGDPIYNHSFSTSQPCIP